MNGAGPHPTMNGALVCFTKKALNLTDPQIFHDELFYSTNLSLYWTLPPNVEHFCHLLKPKILESFRQPWSNRWNESWCKKRESGRKLGNRTVYVRATAGCRYFLLQSPDSLILYEVAFETWLVIRSTVPPLEKIKHQPTPRTAPTNTQTHAHMHKHIRQNIKQMLDLNLAGNSSNSLFATTTKHRSHGRVGGFYCQ